MKILVDLTQEKFYVIYLNGKEFCKISKNNPFEKVLEYLKLSSVNLEEVEWKYEK